MKYNLGFHFWSTLYNYFHSLYRGKLYSRSKIMHLRKFNYRFSNYWSLHLSFVAKLRNMKAFYHFNTIFRFNSNPCKLEFILQWMWFFWLKSENLQLQNSHWVYEYVLRSFFILIWITYSGCDRKLFKNFSIIIEKRE